MNRFGFGFLLGGALAFVVTAGTAGMSLGSDEPAAPPAASATAKSCGDHHGKEGCEKACRESKAGKHSCECKTAEGKAVKSCCGSKQTTAKGCCGQCPSGKGGHEPRK